MARGFIMGMKAWLFPQERRFFDLFEGQARLAREASALLVEMVGKGGIAEKREAIKALELKGDDIVKEVYGLVNTNFITPIDQEDIVRLTQALDDMTDYIFAVANRICLYGVTRPTPEMAEFAGLISQQAMHIEEALKRLRSLTPEDGERQYAPVKALEKSGDDLLNRTVGSLLRGKDAVHIIIHKEIYEYLELVTDKCFAVSCLLLDISMKYS